MLFFATFKIIHLKLLKLMNIIQIIHYSSLIFLLMVYIYISVYNIIFITKYIPIAPNFPGAQFSQFGVFKNNYFAEPIFADHGFRYSTNTVSKISRSLIFEVRCNPRKLCASKIWRYTVYQP